MREFSQVCAFWPKHNLIPTRSNHTRETSHFITSVLNTSPAKDAAPFIVSQLTQDIVSS